MTLRMLSLFSGIGGIDLAAQWAGIETVAFCEIDPFAQKVLAKHWPKVPIFNDVRTLTKSTLSARGIEWFDILAGGFPCQPFSEMGERKGTADDRHLWPQMFRIIEEFKPTWVIGENVAGFIRVALDEVLSDLESAGYEAIPVVLPACAMGADHIRERIFILGYTPGQHECQTMQVRTDAVSGRGDAAIREAGGIDFRSRVPRVDPRSFFESGLARVIHGVPSGLDSRIRGLGNAVAPGQIFPIFEAIARTEVAA